MIAARVVLGVCVTFALVACSGAEDKANQGKGGAKDSAMAAMPGMTTSTDTTHTPEDAKEKSSGAIPAALTLTAAQVAHGKIAWEPATVGATAASGSIPGELTPDEDRTARLGAPARGRVLSVAVSPGDRVRRGQALVTLQSPDAGAAQSDLAKATAIVASSRAQATYARAARERAERLLALKAIPRQDFEKAIADDELAQSQVQQSEAELRRARTLADQLGADATSSGNLVIRSTQDGVVLSRSAVPGAVVDAGVPLLVVTDPSRLWLVVNAPEQFASLLRQGGDLRFVVPAFPDTFSARVTAIGAGLEQSTRTLQVRAATGNMNGRLRPGMLATVIVAARRVAAAVSLPDDAVQSVEGKPTVFIAMPDAGGGVRVTRREVEVGTRSGGRVTVVRGVKAGDVVITSGAFAVKSAFLKGGMPKMEM